MEFGKAPIKDSVPEPSILIVEIDAPEFSKTTKLSLALVIFKFATFAPAISINTFSLVEAKSGQCHLTLDLMM